jgi:hypothetical protein
MLIGLGAFLGELRQETDLRLIIYSCMLKINVFEPILKFPIMPIDIAILYHKI